MSGQEQTDLLIGIGYVLGRILIACVIIFILFWMRKGIYSLSRRIRVLLKKK